MLDMVKPLEGFTFYAPVLEPPLQELRGTYRAELWEANVNTRAELADHARFLGATVFQHDEEPDDDSVRFLSARTTIEGLERQFAIEARTLEKYPYPKVSSIPFADCDFANLEKRLINGDPFVLSYRATSRGIGKYLISDLEQLDRFLDFVEDYPQFDYGNRFHVREYIEASESWRVITNASGEIQAAGIFYRETVPSQSGLIVARPTEVVDAAPYIQLLGATLENPYSQYFLKSPEFRTNFNINANAIPVMGTNFIRDYTENERKILKHLGIDSHNPALPLDLIEYGRWLGPRLAPRMDTTIGLDFLQRRGEYTKYYLEANSDAGPHMNNICNFAGRAESQEAMLDMRLVGLYALLG